jgi:hypothetical protein
MSRSAELPTHPLQNRLSGQIPASWDHRSHGLLLGANVCSMSDDIEIQMLTGQKRLIIE